MRANFFFQSDSGMLFGWCCNCTLLQMIFFKCGEEWCIGILCHILGWIWSSVFCLRWGLLKNKLIAATFLPASLFFWAAQITFQKCLGTHQMFWLKAIMNFDKRFLCFVFLWCPILIFWHLYKQAVYQNSGVTRED